MELLGNGERAKSNGIKEREILLEPRSFLFFLAVLVVCVLFICPILLVLLQYSYHDHGPSAGSLLRGMLACVSEFWKGKEGMVGKEGVENWELKLLRH